MKINADEVRSYLNYSPDTGVFTWKFRIDADNGWNEKHAGRVAGRSSPSRGYVRIGINGNRYLAHRLAWLYMTGNMPIGQIDHINQVRDDNRWSNLRDVTAAINRKNRALQANTSSGFNGVGWRESKGKWRAYIKVQGKNIHIGYYEAIIDAVAERIRASKHFGFHENHGFVESKYRMGVRMNRDELLTQMSMEVAPEDWRDDELRRIYEGYDFGWNEYQLRRAELINKPSWDDAPWWANWLAQDEDGEWWWYESEPELNDVEGCFDAVGRLESICAGIDDIDGHDWRETLESRPDFNESRADAIGQNGNDGLHYMTPEEEELPATEQHNCPKCGGCYYSPPHEKCPCQPSATTADGILAAARQHMLDRASTYDKPEGERSMNSTVLAFAAVTGVLMTEEQGWLFMQLLKAVRSQQGDYRADNYEDGAAYVALAGEAAARDRKFQ